MKSITILKHTLAFAIAGVCFLFAGQANAGAATHFTANAVTHEVPQKVQDDDTRGAKKKANKPVKRKKVKPQRTNHGPKKALFPQVDRKSDPLSRMSYRDTYKNRH